jgi:hypothetical protein
MPSKQRKEKRKSGGDICGSYSCQRACTSDIQRIPKVHKEKGILQENEQKGVKRHLREDIQVTKRETKKHLTSLESTVRYHCTPSAWLNARVA